MSLSWAPSRELAPLRQALLNARCPNSSAFDQEMTKRRTSAGHTSFLCAGASSRCRVGRAAGVRRRGVQGRLPDMIDVHPDAWVSPHAVLNGEVIVGAGSRILDLVVIQAVRGPVVIGSNVVVMEHAVLRGRPDHPVTIGDSVMIGPHTHLNGTRVEDEVFIATGASLFP